MSGCDRAPPFARTVVFSDSKGDHVSVRVGASSALVVHVPSGTYAAVGHSPMVDSEGSEMACSALRPVVVKVGQMQSVTVVCQLV